MSDTILAKYLMLPPADRRAVERQLDSAARAALRAALDKNARVADTPPQSPPALDLKPYSPWLRRHLAQCIAETPAATQTVQAQATLRLILAQRSVAP